MIVSVTERQTYKRCKRKWDLSSFNRRALTPAVTTSGALDLGTLVHKSLADWIVKRRYTAAEAKQLSIEGTINEDTLEVVHPEMLLTDIFKFHAYSRLAEVTASYIKITGGANPSPSEMDPLYEAIEMGAAMMQNYMDFHGSPLPKHMSWVSPEQKVQVPIPNTRCEVCSGSGDYNGTMACPGCNGIGTHVLEGTLDGLVQDKKDRVYVLEHKTYGRRPKIETLETSDQFLAYIWLMHKLGLGQVAGIAYDGMWKRAKPPRGASMNDLFLRTVLKRDRAELDEFEAQLTHEVTNMADDSIRAPLSLPLSVASPVMYTNRQWQGCTDCGYLRLCRAMSRGEDTDYITRTYYTQRIKDDPLGTAAETSGEDEAA